MDDPAGDQGDGQADEGAGPTTASLVLAETFGTFALVFAGTGACVVDGVTGGAVTSVGIAATFGLIVTAMIHAVGPVSGAHMNPAVTVGFLLAGRLPRRHLVPYVGAQLVGAFAASLLLAAMFPLTDRPVGVGLGETVPSGAPAVSMVFEVVLTSFLMLVILGCTRGAGTPLASVAIGGTVALCALFGGPVSGASMNPARSLAPGLVSGNAEHLWLYMVGPLVGAALACQIHRGLHRPRGALAG